MYLFPTPEIALMKIPEKKEENSIAHSEPPRA